VSVSEAEAREAAEAQLAAWRRAEAPATPLHSIAESGARQVLQAGWQAGLDAAVRESAEASRRKGLDARETRRAAARAADAYLRKHPKP
jgi:hypothetical protein